MGALFLWLGSTVASVFMEITNEGRMFKDAADNGYKVNIERIAKLQEELGIKKNKMVFLELLLPVINILGVIKRTIDYNKVRPIILDSLDTINALEEMTDDEKVEYEKKPTIFKAIAISIMSSVRLTTASKMTIDDDVNGKTEVLIDYNGHIIKVNGYAATLSKEEQDEYLLNNFTKLRDKLHEMSEEDIDKAFNEDIDIEISKEDKKEIINDKKEELIKLREELLKSKDNYKEEDNVKKLVRKKDNKK